MQMKKWLAAGLVLALLAGCGVSGAGGNENVSGELAGTEEGLGETEAMEESGQVGADDMLESGASELETELET